MTKWIHILRIKHWMKNLFVIVPAFFSGTIQQNWERSLVGFFAFCALASAIYIINDLKDRDFDKKNPAKKIILAPNNQLYIVSICLTIVSLIIGFYLESLFPLIVYFTLNILYTFKLKEIPFLEILIVSSGFLLRVIFGAEIINVPITIWLYSEVVALTIMIVLSKRIKEINFYQETGIKLRKVISNYKKTTLITSFYILAATIFFIYIIYCINPLVMYRTNLYIWTTIPLVGIGILRFVHVTIRQNKLLNPVQILFKDSLLLSTVVSWIALWTILYYYG